MPNGGILEISGRPQFHDARIVNIHVILIKADKAPTRPHMIANLGEHRFGKPSMNLCIDWFTIGVPYQRVFSKTLFFALYQASSPIKVANNHVSKIV